MSRKQRRKLQQERAVHPAMPPKSAAAEAPSAVWPGERSRLVPLLGVVLIAACTLIIYAQTVSVPPIDYEDSYYLIRNPYVNVTAAFSRLGAVWTEPYFANFHPVTTTTWLVDRALADKSKPFDGLPFRITHLIYSAMAASLLVLLYRKLGIPSILAALGAALYAVHPIHTEVVAWLSARKDVVSMIFIVLAFLAWLRAREAATATQWRLRHAVTILIVLLAVLSKPVAVILPVLFVAYEFCSVGRDALGDGRACVVRRTAGLTAIFLAVGGVSAVVFRSLIPLDPMHGGWLILAPLALMPVLLVLAPPLSELDAFRENRSAGLRVLSPPMAVLSVVFGAGSAWTFWAQAQAGAIKGGLALLPTLNLTFDAMLSYTGRALVPAKMSAVYTWNAYPYVSLRGAIGLAVVCVLLWAGFRLAGSPDRNRRLIAFGIFWFLIAFVPVSNLVPTSTKMADRYLFVPTAGAILALMALASACFAARRQLQFGVLIAMGLVIAGYTAWSYNRTEVWCGKTVFWKEKPQPDLSLWTEAVKTDPQNSSALTSLALVFLRLDPPQPDAALNALNKALTISEASQAKIAGDKQLDISPVYQGLGDAYFAKAAELGSNSAPEALAKRKETYANSVKYFEMASQIPWGFAPSDARLLRRLADACEALAQIAQQQLPGAAPGAAPGQRDALLRERDRLRSEAEDSLRRAQDILVAGHVAPSDPDYRIVLIAKGNLIFGREVGASNEEKSVYYRQALAPYREAAALLPDDPRPFLYEGLCYERLTGITPAGEQKQELFSQAEAALRKALTLQVNSPDYTPAMTYRVLANLDAHMNDFRSALAELKNAQKADPPYAEAVHLDREIQSVEAYLARQPQAPAAAAHR